jgi:hypothetical protein
MVRYNERQQTLKHLEKLLLVLLVEDAGDSDWADDTSDDYLGSDSDEDEELMDVMMLYSSINESRYFNGRNPYKATDWSKAIYLLDVATEKVFTSKIRMSRSAFYKIVDIFGDNPVLHSKNGTKKGLAIQFLVALHRFGCYGNGVNVVLTGDYFGVSGK